MIVMIALQLKDLKKKKNSQSVFSYFSNRNINKTIKQTIKQTI